MILFDRVGPLIGLLLIGIGTGGIKPCVAAFGGDQFSADQVSNRDSKERLEVTAYLLLTSADVLTSRPPSLPDDDRPARILYRISVVERLRRLQ